MFSNFIPENIKQNYFLDISKYDNMFQTKLFKNLKEEFKTNIENNIKNDSSVLHKQIQENIEIIVKEEKEKMKKLLIDEEEKIKQLFHRNFTEQRKSMQNQLNQLKENLQEEFIEDIDKFFNQEHQIIKLKYITQKKQNEKINNQIENIVLKLNYLEENKNECLFLKKDLQNVKIDVLNQKLETMRGNEDLISLRKELHKIKEDYKVEKDKEIIKLKEEIIILKKEKNDFLLELILQNNKNNIVNSVPKQENSKKIFIVDNIKTNEIKVNKHKDINNIFEEEEKTVKQIIEPISNEELFVNNVEINEIGRTNFENTGNILKKEKEKKETTNQFIEPIINKTNVEFQEINGNFMIFKNDNVLSKNIETDIIEEITQNNINVVDLEENDVEEDTDDSTSEECDGFSDLSDEGKEFFKKHKEKEKEYSTDDEIEFSDYD